MHRDTERPRGAGRGVVTHAHAEIVPIPQHGDPLHLRDRLLDQREALGGKNRRVVGNAGDVAAWMRQAVDKARRDRIAGANVNHRRNIRDLAGEGGRIAANHDHIDLVSFHGADDLAKLPDLAAGSARFECKIFTERVAVLRELLQQNRAKR